VKKPSELVEVIWTRDEDIFVDFHLGSFGDCGKTKNDYGHIRAEASLLSYSLRGCNQTLGSKI
jgi:hypothetical protein